MGGTAAQRLGRRLSTEVVSDPLNDVENDPYDNDGSDIQKQLQGHQVAILCKDKLCKRWVLLYFTPIVVSFFLACQINSLEKVMRNQL